jgi:hypothetical protein
MSHVLRVRPVGLFASIGVGALLAGLASISGNAQQASPGLRSALDDDLPVLQRDVPRGSTARARAVPAKRAQTYGNPPGSGAGSTGFVSTNPRRAKAKTSARQPAPVTGQPLSITPRATPSEPSAPPGTELPPAPSLVDVRRTVKKVEPPPVTEPDIRGPVRRRAPREADPFEPTGIHAGSFFLRPAIEVMGGYDTNPSRVTAGGRGSSVLIVAPELQVRSDWSRHELKADLRGSYTAYGSAPSENRPFLDTKVTGRVDVTRQTSIDLEGRHLVSTDKPGSPDIPAGLSRLPVYDTVGATAGVTHRFNRFELALKGSIDRTTYEDSHFTNGAVASNKDRDYIQYGTKLRASYELSPAMKPFVEVGVDTRIHDLPVDAFGVQRDSDGATAKVGTSFWFSPKLIGEASVGYLVRTYQDPTLPELQAPTVDASLIWSATPLTNIKLKIATAADESTVPGVAGVLRHDASLQVDHAFRRWLISTVKLGYGTDQYQGSTREDARYSASLGLAYKLTRTTQVKSELRQEWLRSNIPGNDYTATIALVGLRLQR